MVRVNMVRVDMIRINEDRLHSDIDRIALFSDAEAPAVTRVVFTAADLKARAWMNARCEGAGLAVRQDAIGNTFARWIGSDPSLPVVGTGSHIDAIPNAGKYDGVVGVMGGLEAIRALREAKFRPRHSIDLLVFTSEEPTRFGIGCLGSRLLSGALTAEAARKLTDNDGASLEEVRRSAGLTGELEQGPILEREQIPLGIVERIAAPASLRITVEGAGGHAGGVLMPDRRDALCAAAELILAIERAAKTSGAIDTVATVGICDVFPAAVNSIPARVKLSVDLRDTSLPRRDLVLRTLDDAGHAISASRKVTIVSQLLNADAPAESAPDVVAALCQACEKHGFSFLPMTSRAYHDSLFMSRIAPVAMLFIPCRHGYSHRPDEFASPADIARGTLALAEALAMLAE